MKLSLREVLGTLNEKALEEAHRLIQEGQTEPPETALVQIRKVLAMPAFKGNLLAVRLTDVQKVTAAELPPAMEPARALLLAALQAEICVLEPMYKERLANSHK